MAEPVIGFMVEKFCTYVGKNYISGFFGFEKEFDKLKKSISFLKPFVIDLQESKNQNSRNSEVVKTLVEKFRELIYEADDILVDCEIHADYHRDPNPLITSLHNGDFRHRTKRRLEEINEEISEMQNTIFNYCLPSMFKQINAPEGSNKCATNSRWTSSILIKSEIVGLIRDVRQIKEWILAKNDELHLVAIAGMGGLGKTTLAKKVFNDKQVRAHFKKRIWVSVSKPVDVVRIMKTILQELSITDYSSDSYPATLLLKIKEALNKTTYLIIMDDVWGIEKGWWAQMLNGLTQDGRYNSCIIITTRNEEIAKRMGVGELRIHRPNLLSDEDSWSLLCKVAFSTGICQHHQLQKVGKQIAKKCGGLPLAIKAIGGLLSTKSSSLSEWKKIFDDFRDKLAEVSADTDDSVVASLQLSYDDLPSRLKQCILCFSIYPEDFRIRAKQLVYWWAGEGFIVPGGNSKTTLQVAKDCFSELFSRCLIEPVDGRAVGDDDFFECKMHDMVRDLIIIVAKQQAFCSFDDGDGLVFDKDTRHFGIPRGVSIPSTEFTNSKIRAMILLDMLSPFQTWKQNYNLTKVDSLRVLDLSFCNLQPIHELVEWIKSQKRLTYLNLHSTSSRATMPDFFKYLPNLQYLIISCNSYLKRISVSSLRKLIVLDLSHCYKLECPEGLGNLINLEELSGLKLGSSSARLPDIINLPKLRVLRLSTAGAPNVDMFRRDMCVLSQLGNLQVLYINSFCPLCQEDINKQLDHLEPPASLEELCIHNYMGETMPGFIKPELLPKLQHLTIKNSKLKHLTPDFWGTKEKSWNLEALSLIELPKLEMNWGTVRQMMPLISYAEVKKVPMLESFPGNMFKIKYNVWRKIEEEDAKLRENAVDLIDDEDEDEDEAEPSPKKERVT
ncbi:hypothetical protein C5167_003778 [Papaver somniferum]|uniref:NB-ARC domain-containing protein n=1 Tax=Papaver somniferum TaxID=3469 RepID=A0A4Y7L308_PAPSO|nr:disease resistance RPP13-like protein 4 [Papaver somniferum]XP_026415018.1 disease resistance RPP13-like protein 4 [Papaver somniferum]XP_026415019.1 disease resistance RPP13-like protein 4 [Papaver somniferum]RZC79566.1 hypothetical protein C5167_003778 [Papaver somniferum]